MNRPWSTSSAARRRAPRAAWPNRGLAVALVAGGALLGWLLPRIERNHHLGGFAYDPAAAQATLGAIATGVITLTGFVLTAVTLVVQSVQMMSPRLAGVLGYFERSLVMFGALTGTAVYALVVLSQVGQQHVPRLSVSLAIVFVVLSTGAILRRIAELRGMVTGGGLVRIVGLRLHTALDHVWRGERPAEAPFAEQPFAAEPDAEAPTAQPPPGERPLTGGQPAGQLPIAERPFGAEPTPEPTPEPPTGPTARPPTARPPAAAPPSAAPPRGSEAEPPDAGAEIRAEREGVVLRIDAAAIADIAARLGTRAACQVAVGGFVEPGTVLLRLLGRRPPSAEARRLARAVRVGPSRGIEHDPAYGLRLLADIAIRALSPAVNDPTTAVQALDRIESALLRIAHRPLGTAAVRDRDGVVRVTVPRPSWADLLDLAFAEVLLYGAGSLQVHRRMRALLDTLARESPPDRAAALAPYRATLDLTARTLPVPALAATASEPDPQGLGGPRPDAAAGSAR